MLLPFHLDGEVDHHDGVLFHDADQQNDADERDDGQVGMRQQQRQQCADAGRRQCRQNRDRMDVAFVEHTEHHVHGDECGGNQQRLGRQRGGKRLCGATEGAGDARGHAGLLLGRIDQFDRIAEGNARRQIERERHRGKDARMIDRERRGGRLVVGKGRQRHHATAA